MGTADGAVTVRRTGDNGRAGGCGEVVKGVKECARPPGPEHDSPNHLPAPTRDPDHVIVGERNVTVDERSRRRRAT
ncbi:hypothetical protein GCM10025864_06240 [Luteimicrobium album]|uniref:Uncharacterized protein n=1 Tax=Luteimicrobium album TaxID=1054550 RepID=A0ABQ6HWY4_9MICO|nr:hypothetical protein GCM10025864_06240 [Luteimicrobium album]